MDGEFPGPKGLREQLMRGFADRVFGRFQKHAPTSEAAPAPAFRPPGFRGVPPPLQGYPMESRHETERRSLYEALRAKVRGERLGVESLLAKDYESVREEKKPPAPANDQKRPEPAPLRGMLYDDLKAKVQGEGSAHESLLKHDFDRGRD
jgi:hypothetical protein